MRRQLTAAALGAVLFAAPAFAAESNTPDGWLTSKTKLSLFTTTGVKSSAVHVDTIDGQVTLYGKVDSAAQKQLAEKAVRAVKGVRGVNNLLQVVAPSQEKTVARADKDIQDQANKALSEDTALKDSSITVKSVDKGVVLLTGKARNASDHLRAVSVVDQIAGVNKVASQVESPDFYGDDRYVFTGEKTPALGTAARDVKDEVKMAAKDTKATLQAKADELKVRADVKNGDAKNSLADTRITTAVKMRLLTTPEVPSTQINVDTNNGTVTLFGTVATEILKDTVSAEARKVDGVVGIENQLQVVPTSMKKLVDAKDADISKDVKLKLRDHNALKDITADVQNGAVRMTGSVASGWDELEALRLVRAVPGVKSVQDDLKVNYKPMPEDAARAY